MTDKRFRRLPVGIQSFKVIREENYLYVDKSDIVWNMVNLGEKYNYFSRPRRFGKSVLVDTLESYLEGRKDLFEGLKIMQLEKDWKQYPVIRLDMSRGGANEDTLRSYLNLRFKDYEEKYNITPDPTAMLADRFHAIIATAYKQTGLRVAVLIDEYDSPLQHSWRTPEHEKCTGVYRVSFCHTKGGRRVRTIRIHHRHHQAHTDITLLCPQQSVQHQLHARIRSHLRYYRGGD